MQIKEKMHGQVAVLELKGKLMGGPETVAIHDKVKELVGNDVSPGQQMIELIRARFVFRRTRVIGRRQRGDGTPRATARSDGGAARAAGSDATAPTRRGAGLRPTGTRHPALRRS